MSQDSSLFRYSALKNNEFTHEMRDAYSAKPSAIVEYLDRFVVGQKLAKKKIAIAIRNRWRRNKVPRPLRDDIIPKNILMIGPTGVGKTEIARRVAHLSGAPFIKVEATKFTEVGYVGRDVESIIRDLVDLAIANVKEEKRKALKQKAERSAMRRILEALMANKKKTEEDALLEEDNPGSAKFAKEKLSKDLKSGKLDDSEIEINIKEAQHSGMPTLDVPGMPGAQIGMMNINDIMGKFLGGNKRSKKKRLKVKDAKRILINEEVESLFDEDAIIREALDLVSNRGMVFIDEIDKICTRSESRSGEVNREGVQRDLLPLLEGTTVATKYGTVKTDHILFVGSGAFHFAKPSDLLPELQGRLPIRVELESLTAEDMIKILKDTESSLLKQYCALLETEDVVLEFTEDGINSIADYAITVNSEAENIGARRLHTIMETLLEDISFKSPYKEKRSFLIDKEYVENYLKDIAEDLNLSKCVL